MISALLCALALAKPTDLTFVRHAETVANATGRYAAKSLNVFSERGAAEVVQLTRALLREPRFDLILVSPSPRALRTIAPYLEASGQKATVWPLLDECCTGRRPARARATRFEYGPKVRIPRGLEAYFRLTPGEDRLPVAPDYDSGLAQVEAAAREFKTKYEGGRILLVGHSGQGGHLIHTLTGKWIEVKNAREIHISLP